MLADNINLTYLFGWVYIVYQIGTVFALSSVVVKRSGKNCRYFSKIYSVFSCIPAPNKQIKALAWVAYRNQIDREKLINQFEFQASGLRYIFSMRSLV